MPYRRIRVLSYQAIFYPRFPDIFKGIRLYLQPFTRLVSTSIAVPIDNVLGDEPIVVTPSVVHGLARDCHRLLPLDFPR